MWNEVVVDAVRRVAKQTVGVPIDATTSLLFDLGLSSMQLTELLTQLDRHAGKKMPLEDWFAIELSGGSASVGSLVAWLETNS